MLDRAELTAWRDDVHFEQNVQQLQSFLGQLFIQCPSPEDIIFICIGTDQSTGDSFGPLVGSRLQQLGFPNVIGTLAFPCDAYRVESQVKALQHQAKKVVAIDACLGKEKQVGQFIVKDGPLLPGAATGRRLPEVGDYSIAAVVNELGPKAYWKIQTTSLYIVLQLVETLVSQFAGMWNLERGIADDDKNNDK